MQIKIELKNNRDIKCSNTIIGKTYENEATILHFLLDEELIDKDFYIEFEKTDGTKFSTPKLIIEESKYIEYAIPNSLLDLVGTLKVEVVLRKDNLVFKTYTIKFDILESINATNELPEQYPDFISEAQKILDNLESSYPPGGSTGQVLTKNSDTDYDCVWSNPGQGDMLSSVYDTNNDGVVDNAEKVNNHTIESDVPSNAIFTDTIYDDTEIKQSIASNSESIANIENKIPTKVSELTNDSGYLVEYNETDPTIPDYIKAITEEDIAKWNTGGGSSGGTNDYNELENKPFINLTGTEDSPIYLRTLQTGAYILNGVCSPYSGSEAYMQANNAVTYINYFETVTAVQIFYPPYNQVQYFEVYDNTFTTNTVMLNDLPTKQYVSDSIAAAITTALESDY